MVLFSYALTVLTQEAPVEQGWSSGGGGGGWSSGGSGYSSGGSGWSSGGGGYSGGSDNSGWNGWD